MIRQTVAVFLAFLALYVVTAGGHLYSPDEEIMFRVTESLATRGRLDVEPIRDAGGSGFATRRGADGREYAQYGIANSLFAVPLYWAGDAAARALPPDTGTRLLGFMTVMYLPEGEPAGPAILRRFAVSFFGAIVAAATCALIWRFVMVMGARELSWSGRLDVFTTAERRAWLRAAWLTAAAYGAGTMALPHARTFFSEPPATFFALLSFYFLFGGGGLTPKRAFASGGAFALALLTRLDTIFILPAVGAFLVFRFLDGRGGALRDVMREPAAAVASRLLSRWLIVPVFAFAVPLAAYVLFYFLMNRLHFGGALSSAYADQPEGIKFSTPLLAGLYGFFFSVGKSIFLFSPAILLGIAGYRALWWKHLPLALGLLLCGALLLLLHSRWQNWAGGWCWGPRHIFMLHAFAILPAAQFLAKWTRGRKAVFAAVMVPAVCVQLYGASQSFIDFYILYYRTPQTPPQAMAMYSAEDAAPQNSPAPLNDTIYVPQNSQWYLYADMWDRGYVDNLWLRLARRAKGAERPIL